MQSRADKIIQKCIDLCVKECEKLKNEMYEAEGNYRDTGYERYYKKIGWCDDEIAKLENFYNCKSVWRDQAMAYKHQMEKDELTMMQIKSLIKGITDDDITSPRMAELIERFGRLK